MVKFANLYFMLKFPPPLTLARLMNRFAVVCEIKCKIYLICVKCHCWTVVICGLCENKQGENRRKGAAPRKRESDTSFGTQRI